MANTTLYVAVSCWDLTVVWRQAVDQQCNAIFSAHVKYCRTVLSFFCSSHSHCLCRASRSLQQAMTDRCTKKILAASARVELISTRAAAACQRVNDLCSSRILCTLSAFAADADLRATAARSFASVACFTLLSASWWNLSASASLSAAHRVTTYHL